MATKSIAKAKVESKRPGRDDFSSAVKTLLAQRVGWLCSNPDCQRPTIGPRKGELGSMNVGVAAHIKAASADFARYDALQSREERRHFDNGIWLCQVHAHQIDHDEEHFTVELLHRWKREAEERAFDQLTQGRGPARVEGPSEELMRELRIILAALSIPKKENLPAVRRAVQHASAQQIDAFERQPGSPAHAVELRLIVQPSDGNVASFSAAHLGKALRATQKLAIVAPPGTGKSTTMLQLARSLLAEGNAPVFVPLKEWAETSGDLFSWVANRHDYAGLTADHFKFLAYHGELALLLDGWNEVPPEARRRLILELNGLQRDFPLLCLAISTRRQALDVPLDGRHIAILPLSEAQQLEIAQSVAGEAGPDILDRASDVPGLRDLVTVPLYLSVLLRISQGGHLPDTKEQILRRFVEEHESDPVRAEALDRALLGNATYYLRALAVDAQVSSNTSISSTSALQTVGQVNQSLTSTYVVQNPPNPRDVLDVLVSTHALTTDAGGSYSFQHQQFQEWYASFEIEDRLQTQRAEPLTLTDPLVVERLNDRTWEEAILFACERLSRANLQGAKLVAGVVRIALQVDPMFAATIIRRSSSEVWQFASDVVVRFAYAWHTDKMPDRAVAFMIETGRSEFSDIVWPLVSSSDHAVQFAALRLGPHLDPSILGQKLWTEYKTLPEDTRSNLLGELVDGGGTEATKIALRLALEDDSVKVRREVFESLSFRGAGRQAEDLLRNSTEEVWRAVAFTSDVSVVKSADLLDQLESYRREQLDADPRPRAKLARIGELSPADQERSVETLLADPDFDFRDDHARIVDEASIRFPAAVGRAMRVRIEAGLKLPWEPERYLTDVPLLEEGPVREMLTAEDLSGDAAKNAALVAGSGIIKILCDRYLRAQEVYDSRSERSEAAYRPVKMVTEVLERTNATALLAVIASYPIEMSDDDIRRLCWIVSGHRREFDLVFLQSSTAGKAIRKMNSWARKVLRSKTATREHMAGIARALRRLPDNSQVPLLAKMLHEDLRRYSVAREAYHQNRRDDRALRELQRSHNWDYRDSLVAVGTVDASEALRSVLSDDLFGADAAIGLLLIWRQGLPKPSDDRFRVWPDYEQALVNRNASTAAPNASTSFADDIFSALEPLISSDDPHKLQRAAEMAGAAVGMPHGDRSGILDRLLASRLRARPRLDLVTKMIVGGLVVRADDLNRGLNQLFAEAKTESWLLGQDLSAAMDWLELFPFSDRPIALLDALDELGNNLPARAYVARWWWRDLLRSIRMMPGEESIVLLRDLMRRVPELVEEYELYSALSAQLSKPGAVDLLLEIAGGSGAAGFRYPEEIYDRLGPADIRDLRARLHALARGPAKRLTAEVLLQSNEVEIFLELVADPAGRDAIKQRFSMTLREMVHDRIPLSDSMSHYELRPRDSSELRKGLFELTLSEDVETASFAARCLEHIDSERDEGGTIETEPRHPYIAAGQPWPRVVH
jgi:hypothetical protein